jgi:hypothetical protein
MELLELGQQQGLLGLRSQAPPAQISLADVSFTTSDSSCPALITASTTVGPAGHEDKPCSWATGDLNKPLMFPPLLEAPSVLMFLLTQECHFC